MPGIASSESTNIASAKPAHGSPLKQRQPNIVFVLTDQQRWDTAGVHGNPLDLTPNFDRMAAEGTHAAIRYIHRHRRQPFLLFLSFLEPHQRNQRDDYPAPEGYAERYRGRWTPPDLACLPACDGSGLTGGTAQRDLAGYYGMVRRIDEALGRIRDALRSLQVSDQTIVVFTSDHGCHFKTRNDEYKRSCNESSIRVPLALAGPGFDGGGRLESLVSLIDLAPTLLDAANLPVPSTMQGQSILPHVRGEVAGNDRELLIQISESCVGRALRTPRWKYGVTAPDADGNQRMDAPIYRETFLYDLQSDPYELFNLAGYQSHRELSDWLAQRLLAHMTTAGEPTAQIEPAPAIRSGLSPVKPEFNQINR